MYLRYERGRVHTTCATRQSKSKDERVQRPTAYRGSASLHVGQLGLRRRQAPQPGKDQICGLNCAINSRRMTTISAISGRAV